MRRRQKFVHECSGFLLVAIALRNRSQRSDGKVHDLWGY